MTTQLIAIVVCLAVAIGSAPRCFTFEAIADLVSELLITESQERTADHCHAVEEGKSSGFQKSANLDRKRMCECKIVEANVPHIPVQMTPQIVKFEIVVFEISHPFLPSFSDWPLAVEPPPPKLSV